MKKTARSVIVTLSAGTLLAGSVVFASPATAAPPREPSPSTPQRLDNRPGPLTVQKNAERKLVQQRLLAGDAEADSDGVVQIDDGKYYQAAVTGTDQIFTILAEFGDQGDATLGTDPGPLHNQIPEPDRTVDNSTHWIPDFNTASYEDLFFGEGESLADFYTQQSSGNYTVAGEVSDWVKVPGNASVYGDNTVEDSGGAWKFIADAADAWYQSRVAAGATAAEIDAELATFDVWDRYDHDADGDFNEPDGYIDHFQAVHAGIGEDAGGGAQGEDAIWSHRWYVNSTDFGKTGPSDAALYGGAQIGDSGIWIGDYTVEPENGGLGVFAHEFAHDLGLPDFYDTNDGENSTGFWTLMSSGSWLGHGTEDIGTTPNFMGPWEKLQLGWLDFSVVNPGTPATDYTLNPAAYQQDGTDQALIVDVPDATITTEYTTPAGGHAWWTSSDDNLNSTLTRTIDLTKVKNATLNFSAWYEIEADFDYLYLEYRHAGETTWTPLGDPITGTSADKWKKLKYTLPGGAPLEFRFRYASDGGVSLPGAFIDNITVKSGKNVFVSDTAETGDNGWTAAGGFTISDGTSTSTGDRYYLLENRTYASYDETLQTGPYQFDKPLTQPDHVEHFPFQDGLLVWAVDEAYSDNNTIDHNGHGLALPVDARPALFTYEDGTAPSNRRQPFDATFGLQALDGVSLHTEKLVGKGKKAKVTSFTAVGSTASEKQTATFTDIDPNAYFSETNPLGGVYVAGHGVTATVTSQITGGNLTVQVTNPAE